MTEQGVVAKSPVASQRKLALEISARSVLITLGTVREIRGCDAESVLDSVGDATHPKCLRWVFDVGVQPSADKRRRELRFWKDEVVCPESFYRFADPKAMIADIVPARQFFPRGEIEIEWTINAMTISRLIKAGELAEVNRQIPRASLLACLERRLQ